MVVPQRRRMAAMFILWWWLRRRRTQRQDERQRMEHARQRIELARQRMELARQRTELARRQRMELARRHDEERQAELAAAEARARQYNTSMIGLVLSRAHDESLRAASISKELRSASALAGASAGEGDQRDDGYGMPHDAGSLGQESIRADAAPDAASEVCSAWRVRSEGDRSGHAFHPIASGSMPVSTVSKKRKAPATRVHPRYRNRVRKKARRRRCHRRTVKPSNPESAWYDHIPLLYTRLCRHVTRVILLRSCGRDKLMALMVLQHHEIREQRIEMERRREEEQAELRRMEAEETAGQRRMEEELRREEEELRREEEEQRRQENRQDRMMMMMMTMMVASCRNGAGDSDG